MRQFNHDPEAITRRRQDAGLTKTALAERLECSLSLVSEIESGTRNARPYLLARMAGVFGCPVSELESRRPPAEAPPVDLQQVRGEERASTDDLPELRRELR